MEPMTTIFGIPLLIVVAVLVATFVRAKNYKSNAKTPLLRFLDHFGSALASFLSGVFFYHPVAMFFGLAEHLFFIVAVTVALVAQAVMEAIYAVASDRKSMTLLVKSFFKDLLTFLYNKLK